MQPTHLSSLKTGAHSVINCVGQDPVLSERLLCMGITPGQTIRVDNRQLFSGPLLVSSPVSSIGLRHADARHLQVTPLAART
ncbi:MAG: ferrous iron transport protein A [Calothrix sp. SM1_5_4]|nr:ferrous iron transport protein A [Calothrix sp. SM1_5_4]